MHEEAMTLRRARPGQDAPVPAAGAPAELAWTRKALTAALVALALSVAAQAGLWMRIDHVREDIERLQLALPKLADRKINELTPTLEARAQRVEEAAAKVGASVARAEEAMKQSEERMIRRMEQRLPQMLDRYIADRLGRLEKR